MAWTKTGSLKGPKGDPGTGTKGDQGQKGDPGPRGSQWFTGSGAPTTVTGSQAGDMYLDVDTGDVYKLS